MQGSKLEVGWGDSEHQFTRQMLPKSPLCPRHPARHRGNRTEKSPGRLKELTFCSKKDAVEQREKQ